MPNTVLLQNQDSGALEPVALDKVDEALASGKYARTSDSTVQTERLGTTASNTLEGGRAQAAGGAVVTSGTAKAAQEAHEAALNANAAASDKLLTFAEGAIDAASLGLIREHGLIADLRREANPGSAMAGELVGSFTPGPEAIMSAGRAAGKAAAGGVLKEGGLLWHAASEAAAGSAVAGAMSFGHQLSDAVIEDKDFAGAAILNDVKLGAIVGGVTGAGLGIYGKLRGASRTEVVGQGGLLDPKSPESTAVHADINAGIKAMDDVLSTHSQRLGVIESLKGESVFDPAMAGDLRKQVNLAQRLRNKLGEMDPVRAMAGADHGYHQAWIKNMEAYQAALVDLDNAMSAGARQTDAEAAMRRMRDNPVILGKPEDHVIPPGAPGYDWGEAPAYRGEFTDIKKQAARDAVAKRMRDQGIPVPEGMAAGSPAEGLPLREPGSYDPNVVAGEINGPQPREVEPEIPRPAENVTPERVPMSRAMTPKELAVPSEAAPLDAGESIVHQEDEAIMWGRVMQEHGAFGGERPMLGSGYRYESGFRDRGATVPGVAPGDQQMIERAAMKRRARLPDEISTGNGKVGGGTEKGISAADAHDLVTNQPQGILPSETPLSQRKTLATPAQTAQDFVSAAQEHAAGVHPNTVDRNALGQVAAERQLAGKFKTTEVPVQRPGEMAGPREKTAPGPAVQKFIDDWYAKMGSRVRPTPADLAAAKMESTVGAIRTATGGRLDAVSAMGVLEQAKIKPAATAFGSQVQQVYAARMLARMVADESRGVATPLRKGALNRAVSWIVGKAGGRMGAEVGAGLAGYAVGGPVGYLLGARLAKEVESLAGITGKVAGSAGRQKLQVVKVAQDVLSGTKATNAAVAAVSANVPRSYDGGKPEPDPVQRILQLQRVAAQPDALRERLQSAFAGAALVVPDVAGKAVDLGTQQLIQLSLRAPRIYFDAFGNAMGVGAQDLRKWLTWENVTHDPGAVLQAVANGSATDTQLAAFRVQHPDLHGALQAAVLGNYQKLSSLPREQLRRVERVIGMPMTPGADPMFLMRQQAAWNLHAADAAAQNQSTGAGHMTPPAPTPMQAGPRAPGN